MLDFYSVNTDYLSRYSANRVNFGSYRNLDGYNWTRNMWSGGWNAYVGSAIPGKNATLAGLAELITADENDWKLIAAKPNVIEGKAVNIQPLLRKFELIVAATKKFLAVFRSADRQRRR